MVTIKNVVWLMVQWLVTAGVQSDDYNMYILFTSVMSHLITWLIVYSRGIHENFIQDVRLVMSYIPQCINNAFIVKESNL